MRGKSKRKPGIDEKDPILIQEEASIKKQGIAEFAALKGVAIAIFTISLLHLYTEKRVNRVNPQTGEVTYTNKYECIFGTIHEEYPRGSAKESDWQKFGDIVIDHFLELALFSALAGFFIYRINTKKETNKESKTPSSPEVSTSGKH